MSFSLLFGATPALLRDDSALIDAFWYLQKGSTAVSCGLYRSPAGTYTLRVYRDGFEYRHSTGDEASLRREAAAKLEALLATNWEQIT